MVMNNAVVEQVGEPQEIYNHPKTVFVANFIGTMNLYRKEGEMYGVRPESISISRNRSSRKWKTGKEKSRK